MFWSSDYWLASVKPPAAEGRRNNFLCNAKRYAHIREAIRLSGGKKPVISAKCYAYDTEGARASLEKARKEMDIDYIDIFMMHEQESRLTLRGHREAL